MLCWTLATFLNDFILLRGISSGDEGIRTPVFRISKLRQQTSFVTTWGLEPHLRLLRLCANQLHQRSTSLFWESFCKIQALKFATSKASQSIRESNSLHNAWQACILTIWPMDYYYETNVSLFIESVKILNLYLTLKLHIHYNSSLLQ